jgi:GNAT superfamily N-acetyltransferase
MSSVREARVTDIADIFRVRTSVRENHLDEAALAAIGITRSTVASMLENGDAKAWCVDVGGKVVGFSLAMRSSREIDALFVMPEFEARGLGSSLLDAAAAWLFGQGDGPIRLKSDPGTRAFAFYQRRGWKPLTDDPDTLTESGDRYLQLDVL